MDALERDEERTREQNREGRLDIIRNITHVKLLDEVLLIMGNSAVHHATSSILLYLLHIVIPDDALVLNTSSFLLI